MATNRLLKIVFSLIGLGVATHSVAFNGFGTDIDGYIKDASNRYQVDEAMLRGLVKIEDGWYGNVSPTGATGVGQFTRGTWNWLATTDEGRALGMTQITRYNRDTPFDPRKNNQLNTLATALLARWHINQFFERGIKPSHENLYLAHNIGIDGLHRALQGRATREDILNMKRNGMKKGMSVQGFLVYQSERFNVSKQIANFQRLQYHHVIKLRINHYQPIYIGFLQQKPLCVGLSQRQIKQINKLFVGKIQPINTRTELCSINPFSSLWSA